MMRGMVGREGGMVGREREGDVMQPSRVKHVILMDILCSSPCELDH